MKVYQLENLNQFVIKHGGYTYFQSYNSLIAVYHYDYEKGIYELTLGGNWDYSMTTLKHLYLFLQEYTCINIDSQKNKRQAIQNLIDKGVIKYDKDMY